MIAHVRRARPLRLLIVIASLWPVAAAQAAPSVPPGFRIAPYARGLEQPTALALGPNGIVYVTTKGGTVLALPRRGARPRVVVSGLRDSTLGVAYARGALYVSDLGRVLRVPVRLRDGAALGPARPIVSGLPHGRHQNDTLVLGPGGRLYLGIGTTCDACRDRDPRSGTIVSFRRDGSGFRIVARGLRNPYGLAVDARGRLWATDEGRDRPDGVPEELNLILPGRRYGWPSCWGRGGGSGCRGTRPATVVYEPHSAATGLAFAPAAWGAALRGDVLIAHWGTYFGRAHGRYVSRTRFTSRGPRVTRFVRGLDHPIAVLAVGPRVLVADFGTGVVWQIVRG